MPWEFGSFLPKITLLIAVLEQPPYSPDLALCDFFLFPKLKEVIKRTRFQDSEAIKIAVTISVCRIL